MSSWSVVSMPGKTDPSPQPPRAILPESHNLASHWAQPREAVARDPDSRENSKNLFLFLPCSSYPGAELSMTLCWFLQGSSALPDTWMDPNLVPNLCCTFCGGADWSQEEKWGRNTAKCITSMHLPIQILAWTEHPGQQGKPHLLSPSCELQKVPVRELLGISNKALSVCMSFCFQPLAPQTEMNQGTSDSQSEHILG